MSGRYVRPKTALEIFFGFFHVMHLTVISTSASYKSIELFLGDSVLLEKLKVAQVVKNVSPSILLEESLSYSQERAIGSYPEPVKSRPQPHIQYFIKTFDIILTSTLRSLSGFFLSGFQLHFLMYLSPHLSLLLA
jgi:hypothetical protein